MPFLTLRFISARSCYQRKSIFCPPFEQISAIYSAYSVETVNCNADECSADSPLSYTTYTDSPPTRDCAMLDSLKDKQSRGSIALNFNGREEPLWAGRNVMHFRRVLVTDEELLAGEPRNYRSCMSYYEKYTRS